MSSTGRLLDESFIDKVEDKDGEFGICGTLGARFVADRLLLGPIGLENHGVSTCAM